MACKARTATPRTRRRTVDQKGFALISALVLTFLFFALVALLMIESTSVLRAALHFRSRIVAQSLAESGAELAARSMMANGSTTITTELPEGTVKGEYTKSSSIVGERFVISGTGSTKGADAMTASVRLYGSVTGGSIQVEQSEHSQ
jgi:type II secretory pathway component PulK